MSSALGSKGNVENVIHTRMLKRFQNLQEKYSDLLSYNSVSSLGTERRGSDFESRHVERLSKSFTGRFGASLKRFADIGIEPTPLVQKQRALQNLTRLDIKRP